MNSRVLLAVVGVSVMVGSAMGVLLVPGGVWRVQAVAPAGNGDVNGDGKIDIGDAVYLLSHLFGGGASPVPFRGLEACQEDLAECQEDLQAHEALVLALDAELASCEPALAECQEALASCESDLASTWELYLEYRDALGRCAADLETRGAQVSVLENQLAMSEADRRVLQHQLAACQANLKACAHVGLPATGQTLCYDTEGVVIDCSSVECPGQDGFYQSACSMEGRFVDNGDGTVTDLCTGLMWQKETADIDGDGKITEADRLAWENALQYCETVELAGYTDWRLPNVRELESLLDHGRWDPALGPVFGAVSWWYWSSSIYVYAPKHAWCVDVYGGNVGERHRSQSDLYVRAVRGPADDQPACPRQGLPATGQTLCYDAEGEVIDCLDEQWPGQDGSYRAGCPMDGRFVDNGDGTLTDLCTGLMWQKSTADIDGNGEITEADRLNWQEALQYGEGLELCGYTDWRLPNVRELQSIVDYGRVTPAMDPAFGAESSWYWSSSTCASSADNARRVRFYDGYVSHTDRTAMSYVRAVRDWGGSLDGIQRALGLYARDLEARTARVAALEANLAACRAIVDAGLHVGLPATGQDLCYNSSGYVTDCSGADYPGQDGFYRAGCAMAGRFIDHEDGTVTDQCTGLMWQKSTADTNGDGLIDHADQVRWDNALLYCENLEFAGHTDWRLPNVRELQSLLDYGRRFPVIDPVFGLGPSSPQVTWYWTSSTRIYQPDSSYAISFHVGISSVGHKRFGIGYVRAVRG